MIMIGMFVFFIGFNGVYGIDMQQIIQVYFVQINKIGGINGCKLDLVVFDDGYEMECMVVNIKMLFKEKNSFVLFVYYGFSFIIEVMNSIFGLVKVLLIGIIFGVNMLCELIVINLNLCYMFNVCVSYVDEIDVIVN